MAAGGRAAMPSGSTRRRKRRPSAMQTGGIFQLLFFPQRRTPPYIQTPCSSRRFSRSWTYAEDIYAQLGQILIGDKKGRENDDEIIYFNAVGTGILDLAVTTRCYRKALELGKGVKLAYWE